MLPTLKHGELVCIQKYNLELNYNDIIVIKKNGRTIIKRLVGMPNDKIKIDNYLYVNDIKQENWVIENTGDVKQEIQLKNNEYFVLGDNVENSIDSRSNEIGLISQEEIIGKIVLKKGDFKCKH